MEKAVNLLSFFMVENWKEIENRAGLYCFKENGKIIYIGQSVDLRRRVGTYFSEKGKASMRKKITEKHGINSYEGIRDKFEIGIVYLDSYSKHDISLEECLHIGYYRPKYNFYE